MSDDDETEVEVEELEPEESFTLTIEPHKIDWETLPSSPKGVARKGLACGWEMNAWASEGEVADILFLAGTDDHNVGDVRNDGYLLRVFTVEAIDRAHKLGFQARYSGRVYADGRKAAVGSFDWARVADPVGVPTELRYGYPPIKVKRGADMRGRVNEPFASMNRRIKAEKARAEMLISTMNDGALWWPTAKFFSKSTPFEAWLTEWMSFA